MTFSSEGVSSTACKQVITACSDTTDIGTSTVVTNFGVLFQQFIILSKGPVLRTDEVDQTQNSLARTTVLILPISLEKDQLGLV